MKKISFMMAFVMAFLLIATPLGSMGNAQAFSSSEIKWSDFKYHSDGMSISGAYIAGNDGYVYAYVYADWYPDFNADTYPTLYGSDKTTAVASFDSVYVGRNPYNELLYVYKLKILDQTELQMPQTSYPYTVAYYKLNGAKAPNYRDSNGLGYIYIDKPAYLDITLTDTPVPAPEKNTGLAASADGKWRYYINKQPVTDYTGPVYDQNLGWWYLENGAVNFNYNGYILYEGSWWAVAGGRLYPEYTGLWGNDAQGWWYAENGVINTNYNGFVEFAGLWWAVANGQVQFGYTGIWGNAAMGWWYAQNGCIDFSYSGSADFAGTTYSVQNGQVMF